MTDPVEQKEWAEGLLRSIDAAAPYSTATIATDQARDLAAAVISLAGEVERLEAERQSVLDAVNLYGDEILHGALDAIGWFVREANPPTRCFQCSTGRHDKCDSGACSHTRAASRKPCACVAAALSPLPSERKGP